MPPINPNVFVKPSPLSAAQQQELGAAERVVLDPQQQFRPLAAAGEWKPRDLYWERRLRDGDVIAIEPPTPIPAAAPAAIPADEAKESN